MVDTMMDPDFVRGRIAELGLRHTYTRTPMTTAALEDSEGDRPLVPGLAQPDLPCQYGDRQFIRDETGRRVTIYTPNLRLPDDSELQVNDLVSNVLDDDGRLLLAGPITVEAINRGAPAGSTIYAVATLQGGQVR